MVTKMSLGCDPEFFLRYRSTHKNVSAHDKVPGTKKEPYPLPNGGSVQADGTAIEFNTVPAYSAKEFSDNIRSCLNDIRKMVDDKFEFCFRPVVHYGPATFDKISDSAKELGCDPDYCAYTLAPNPRPEPPPEFPTMRTGAGHLHIGWTSGVKDVYNKVHMEDCAYFVKILDNSIYEDALYGWAFEDRDEDLRRKVYGKRGAFRPKPFGVEYRSLSNSWLAYGPEMYQYIFNIVEYRYEKAMDSKAFYKYIPYPVAAKRNPYM